MTAAEMHPDLPMTVDKQSRRLNHHERVILRRLIYTLTGREEWQLSKLLPEALAICDNKIAPVANQKQNKRTRS